MTYEPYVDYTFYINEYGGTVLTDENVANKFLKLASRHIDSLTYNRIVGRGFDNLTEFQRGIIQEVCCSMAEFDYENEDMINSILTSYGINGVSMTFGEGWNLVCQSGVAIKRDTYELLSQTGLCCRSLGV